MRKRNKLDLKIVLSHLISKRNTDELLVRHCKALFHLSYHINHNNNHGYAYIIEVFAYFMVSIQHNFMIYSWPGHTSDLHSARLRVVQALYKANGSYTGQTGQNCLFP